MVFAHADNISLYLFTQAQITSLTQSNENQLQEMKRLEKEIEQQKHLKEQLSSSNQTIKELQTQIKHLEAELSDANSTLAELQDNEMKSYKNKLIKALNEVSHLQTQLYQRDDDIDALKKQIGELMAELESVQKQRFLLEREREALKKEIADLKRQLAKAKSKLYGCGLLVYELVTCSAMNMQRCKSVYTSLSVRTIQTNLKTCYQYTGAN